LAGMRAASVFFDELAARVIFTDLATAVPSI
jgi:hypothetical protein